MRKTYLDITRLIACFLVIVNHTNSRIFLALSPSLTWGASVTYFFVSKIAVPLFLLVSGDLLLGKTDGYKKTLRRFLRILGALLLFSFAYYLKDCGGHIGITDFLLTVYRTNITNAFWYLYLYLGVILMLPLLQKLFERAEKRDYIYFCVFSLLIVGGIPYFRHFIPALSDSVNVYVPLFSAYLGLMAAGRYFGSIAPPNGKTALISAAVFIVCIALNVVGTYFEYRADSSYYLFFDNRVYALITVPSVCAFIMLKYLFSRITVPEKTEKALAYVSGLTFGAYLLSDMALGLSENAFTALSAHIHPLFAMVLWELGIYIVCLAAAAVIKAIPFIKRLI